MLVERKSLQDSSLARLDEMEAVITKRLIDAALQNKDASYKQQYFSLVSGYRESLLFIDKIAAPQIPGREGEERNALQQSLVQALDDLSLRLTIMNAADAELVAFSRLVSDSVRQYRANVIQAAAALTENDLLLLGLNDLRAEALRYLAAEDRITATRSALVRDEIQRTVQTGGVTVFFLTLVIAALAVWQTLRIIKSKINKPLEHVLALIDGIHESRPIDRVRAPSEDEWGRIESSMLDMWDRVSLAQAQLRESEERLRLLLYSTGEGMFGLDVQGNCVFCNPSCLKLLGYDAAEELLNKNMHSRIHHSYPDGSCIPVESCRILHTLRSGGEGVRIDDEVFWRADGSAFPVQYSSYPEIHDGAVIGAVVVFSDISERKLAAAALRQAHDQLELRVQERTEELSRTVQDLQVARAQAEAGNRAKSEFLANMTHELRTPLNGVLGVLQLLEFNAPDAEQRELVEAAISSSQRLNRLLSDVIDFSRSESGQVEIQIADFSLEALLESVRSLFVIEAKEKGLALDFHVDPATPQHLQGDERRLRQILFNLVGNALKFTEQGRVAVEVAAVSGLDRSPIWVRFTVSDTGIGIPDDRLKDIFKPFVQAEGAFDRKYQGAGLGLTIVKRLTDLMGGAISLESIEGQGTSVHVSLPLGLGKQYQTAP